MALDARIPLGVQPMQIEPRENALMRMYQVQGAQQQQQMNALKMQQYQQAAQQAMQEKQAAAQKQQQIDGYLQSMSGRMGPPQPFNPAEAAQRLGIDGASKLQGLMQPKGSEGFTLTPGAMRYGPTGQLIASAPTAPKEQRLPAVGELQAFRDTLPPNDPRRREVQGVIDNMTRPPKYAGAPSGGGAGAAAPAQPTPVKLTAAQEKAEIEKQKTGRQSEQMLSAIQTARSLLGSNPTQSGIGSAVDAAGRMFGMTSDSAQTAAKLETLSGWMVANVPRMEGPQSNFDIQNYQTMAAKVGDRSVPVSERLAALSTLEELHRTYADINGTPMPAPNRPKVDTNAGVPGDIADIMKKYGK